MSDIKHFRTDYGKQELNRKNLPTNPIVLFKRWLADAMASVPKDANAFVLSSVALDGSPHSRVLLLREVLEGGFIFFTNYNSQKGQEMDANPAVSMNLFWPELERQVRINGVVEKVSAEKSDVYFASRPYESKVGAWASEQSSAIDSRMTLEERYVLFSEKYTEEVPRPSHWGGYLIKPTTMEFWQGRSSRLHDRFRFTLADEQWTVDRLAP